MPRTVLIHASVTVPDADGRSTPDIVQALEGAIEVGSDDETVRGLEVVLAEVIEESRGTKIECTFRPQAWVNDNAIPVDSEGPATWFTHVEKLPEADSYESDELRHTAPHEWIREWSGPFDVHFEVVREGDSRILESEARDEAARHAAERRWVSDDLEIDTGARVIHLDEQGTGVEGAAWVSAWVFVDPDEIQEQL